MTDTNTDATQDFTMADLAYKVGVAVADHANPSDELEDTFPGWPLDARRDADMIARLQRGEGRPHEVKLHTDAAGQHWAVHDFDAAMQARAAEDQAYDARPASDIVSERPDPDRPPYRSSRAPRHDAEANRVYEHVGAMAGVRLFEALIQGAMARKEKQE